MKTTIQFLCISVCLFLFACSKSDDAPLPNDVISIEYTEGGMAGSKHIAYYADSTRLVNKYQYMSTLVTHDTLITINPPSLSSLIRTIPLDEFWTLKNNSGNPRIADENQCSMTIRGYARTENKSMTNRAIIVKSVRFTDGSVHSEIQPAVSKIDSMITALTPKKK